MASVQTTNPLPNGLYSIDLSPPTSSSRKDGPAVFAAWAKAHRDRVVVRRVVARDDGPTRIAFEVRGRPGAFPFGQLGYPTIATDVGSFADVLESASELEGLAVLFILWALSKRR